MAEILSASHLLEDNIGVTRGVSKRESDPSERRNYEDRIYELQGDVNSGLLIKCLIKRLCIFDNANLRERMCDVAVCIINDGNY